MEIIYPVKPQDMLASAILHYATDEMSEAFENGAKANAELTYKHYSVTSKKHYKTKRTPLEAVIRQNAQPEITRNMLQCLFDYKLRKNALCERGLTLAIAEENVTAVQFLLEYGVTLANNHDYIYGTFHKPEQIRLPQPVSAWEHVRQHARQIEIMDLLILHKALSPSTLATTQNNGLVPGAIQQRIKLYLAQAISKDFKSQKEAYFQSSKPAKNNFNSQPKKPRI